MALHPFLCLGRVKIWRPPGRCIFPCYSDWSQACPGWPPFPLREGGEKEGGRAQPQVHTTVYRVRWTDSSCPVSRAQLLLNPPPPLPCACHCYQGLQHHHPVLHLEPSRGFGCKASRQQLVEVLSDFKQEVSWVRILVAGTTSRNAWVKAAIVLCSPLQSPTLGWACWTASSM